MTTITEDYVSFELAKLLKEKGFDGQCRAAYTNYGKLFTTQIQQYVTNVLCSKGKLWDCAAPTLQMAMKWLREIHGYVIVVEPGLSEDKYVWTYKVIFYRTRTILLQHEDNVGSSTYEEACEAAIKYCLEHLI